jgi:hypothetical protein
MGQSTYPVASSGGTTSQLPVGTSQVIIDGTLAADATKTVTKTIKAGIYLCYATTGSTFTTSPTSYTVTVPSYSTTPTFLYVITDQTSITVTNNSSIIASRFTLQNLNGLINTSAYGIAYGNGRVVCPQIDGQSSNYTLDGRTWYNGGTVGNNSAISWSGIAYGSGRFVVNGYYPTAQTNYSTDGVTWTIGSMASSANYWGMYYGGGLFVAQAWGPSTICNTSTDGLTWTARTLPYNYNWYFGWYGNGLHIAVAGSQSNYATSSDGATWTGRTTLPSAQTWNGGCYGEKHVAIAANSTTYATSTDGLTWTSRTFPEAMSAKIIWDGTKYWVASTNTYTVYTSTDAITWTARTQTVSPPAAWVYYPGIGIIGQGYIISGSNASFGAYGGTSTLG